MILSDNELLRYQRQMVLEECGLDGQLKLKRAKLVVVGAGGLGTPVSSYLVAAGIGQLTIIDHDTSIISNLHAEILFNSNDVGRKKTAVIYDRLKAINPNVQIDIIQEKLTQHNALSLLCDNDVIIDATDNFASRYLINDCSFLLDIPLVSASILRFEGQLCVNYKKGPSYRCLFPEPPTNEQILNCSQAGVFGFLPSMLGSMQANEAIKIILDVGQVLRGQLWMYNALSNETQVATFERNESYLTTFYQEFDLRTFDYEGSCGISIDRRINHIDLPVLLNHLEDFIVIDVRESYEQPEWTYGPCLRIPLPRLKSMWNQLPLDKKLCFICQKGIRSRKLFHTCKMN